MKGLKGKKFKLTPALKAEILKIIDERLKFWGYEVEEEKPPQERKTKRNKYGASKKQ